MITSYTMPLYLLLLFMPSGILSPTFGSDDYFMLLSILFHTFGSLFQFHLSNVLLSPVRLFMFATYAMPRPSWFVCQFILLLSSSWFELLVTSIGDLVTRFGRAGAAAITVVRSHTSFRADARHQINLSDKADYYVCNSLAMLLLMTKGRIWLATPFFFFFDCIGIADCFTVMLQLHGYTYDSVTRGFLISWCLFPLSRWIDCYCSCFKCLIRVIEGINSCGLAPTRIFVFVLRSVSGSTFEIEITFVMLSLPAIG